MPDRHITDTHLFLQRRASGWPRLPCFPFPFQNCWCPVLAFFARACPELAEGAGTMLPILFDLLCPAACIAPTALITCTLSLPRATGDCLFCAARSAAIHSLKFWNRLASVIASSSSVML